MNFRKEEAYEEEMTQAEKLQIEMMRMGGNKAELPSIKERREAWA